MKNRDVESEAAGRKSNIETDKQNISFLYLSEEDMIDAGVLNPGRCVDVMEETMGLMEDGDFLMGGPYNDAHGLMLYFPKKSPIENFPVNNARDRDSSPCRHILAADSMWQVKSGMDQMATTDR